MDVLVSGRIDLRNVDYRPTLTAEFVGQPIDLAERNNSFVSLEIAPRRIPAKFRTCIVNNYWFIAIKERGEDIYNLDNLTILDPPPGHFWADPFSRANTCSSRTTIMKKGLFASASSTA